MQTELPPPNTLPSLVHKIASIVERIDLATLFPKMQPLEVELGAGDGSFLSKHAALHPEHNYIGLERLRGRVQRLEKKAQRAGLTNLRIVRIEAAYFLQYLLPPQSVTALHVYFPDPWPKRRHWHHRLINERFTELARQVLLPGGVVYLRTDDAPYFAQMTSVFNANAAFAKYEAPLSLREIVTDFERNFNARGISTLAAAYQLK